MYVAKHRLSEHDEAKYQVDNATHKIDFNNCAILGFLNHLRKHNLIKESLYIQKFNPSMNVSVDSSCPHLKFNNYYTW